MTPPDKETFRIEAEKQLSDHEGHYEKYRERFLMYDIHEENKERFPAEYDDMIKLKI